MPRMLLSLRTERTISWLASRMAFSTRRAGTGRPASSTPGERKEAGMVGSLRGSVWNRPALSGTVLAVNAQLDEHPALLNEDPYGEGWLIEARLNNESELESLMDMDEYYHFVFKEEE